MLPDEVSRSLPGWALHPATAVLLILMLRAAMQTPHMSGRLLIVVVWLRYVMQAYHEFTYMNVGGVSVNALVSVAVCGVGGFILLRRLPELGRFPLLICLVLTIAGSGLMNGALMPTVETLLKWGYFVVVMLAALDCIRQDGDARIFRQLLWAFAPVLVYQALSIGLGVSKATESDGSVSYIGGFNHEAAFSIVLITGMAIVALTPRLPTLVSLGLMGACLAGVVIANYRTSLIAGVPIIFGFLVFGAAHAIKPGRRLIISLIGLLVMAGAAVGATTVMADRMTDVGAIAEQGEILRSPEQFTEAERKLLSGRLYLWNLYVEDYSRGDDMHLLLGNGADAWVDKFGLYAHNTLVSYLYEFGILGALLLVSVWVAMIVRSFRVQDWTLRGQLVCAHLGFVLLNMATMPFWMVEGLIFYGLLCGYTVAATSRVFADQRAPARPHAARPAIPLAARRRMRAMETET